MKVNSLGVQTYQQTKWREQIARPHNAVTAENAQEDKQVIAPQHPAHVSKLAVKGPTLAAQEGLTEAEAKAFELLFAKFRQTDHLSGIGTQPSTTAVLGKLIDVKV